MIIIYHYKYISIFSIYYKSIVYVKIKKFILLCFYALVVNSVKLFNNLVKFSLINNICASDNNKLF